jgi:hypothetical protein
MNPVILFGAVPSISIGKNCKRGSFLQMPVFAGKKRLSTDKTRQIRRGIFFFYQAGIWPCLR